MRVLVVVVDLDIVEQELPGHVFVVEVAAPRGEGRRPEVHLERLGIVYMLNSRIISSSVSQLASINSPADVLRGPFKLVSVPLVLRVEVIGVLMRLQLLVPIAVDHVHGEGV